MIGKTLSPTFRFPFRLLIRNLLGCHPNTISRLWSKKKLRRSIFLQKIDFVWSIYNFFLSHLAKYQKIFFRIFFSNSAFILSAFLSVEHPNSSATDWRGRKNAVSVIIRLRRISQRMNKKTLIQNQDFGILAGCSTDVF